MGRRRDASGNFMASSSFGKTPANRLLPGDLE